MLVAAAIGAFAVTALSGCFVIPALHKLHFGQTIRESGPTWHNKKQGTPTMGGLCFIFGILVACGLVYAGFYRYAQDLLGIVQVRAALLALFLAFGSGFIGFLDDYIKVVKHRNLGLLAWQKLIMQFIVTGGFLVGLHMQGLLTTIIMLPFIGAVDLGWVYYPIAFFGIIFLVNAVNLTDAWAEQDDYLDDDHSGDGDSGDDPRTDATSDGRPPCAGRAGIRLHSTAFKIRSLHAPPSDKYFKT